MEDSLSLSLEDRLTFSLKEISLRVDFKGIGNVFKALSIPFLFILQESLWEYQGQGSSSPRAMPALKAPARRLLSLKDAITPLMLRENSIHLATNT